VSGAVHMVRPPVMQHHFQNMGLRVYQLSGLETDAVYRTRVCITITPCSCYRHVMFACASYYALHVNRIYL
jgi:hypothetical protein